MQTQDFNNLPVQPITTSSGFLRSGRHNLNSVGRFLSTTTTTFPVFIDGFSNLAESLPQQQKSASNGARGFLYLYHSQKNNHYNWLSQKLSDI
jgi:hypothetical protein